jgi:hypothetical protein
MQIAVRGLPVTVRRCLRSCRGNERVLDQTPRCCLARRSWADQAKNGFPESTKNVMTTGHLE